MSSRENIFHKLEIHYRLLRSKFGHFGECVRGELLGSSHVSFDFHLALHESSLGVQSSVEDCHSIGVHHGENGVGLTDFTLGQGSVSVLEVESPDNGRLSLFGTYLKLVNITNFLDDVSTTGLKEWLKLVENLLDFE